VYWWNPLVWFIRRRIHEAEDLCCDAWVRWAFPEGRKSYAEVVLKAAESLSASHVGRKLLPASPFLRSLSLKERIEMILESRFHPRVSLPSTLLIAFVAVLVLPTFVRFTKGAAAAQDEKAPPAAKSEAADSAFPYTVKFEQGATKFLEGDKITILEVRGTAETFKPGDIYWIKGAYSLASHDRATLAAYTTAKNAADGTGKSYTAQTTTVKKGSGTFTLFLPMACEGWPHISFYGGGEGFGGNYFGTGDSVLERWWGAKRAAEKTDALPANFPYVVKFEQGATKFLEDDKITILEVRGTAETFKPGDIYRIKGTYSLASHDHATLAAYTTAKNAADGRSSSYSAQTTTVEKGNGTFTLFMPMACEGWPHVSFYPAEGGEGFGGNYFGTGDSVLERWWGSKEGRAGVGRQ
ncbi:MAG: M56 family metallopeptidase, partial [Pirellulales bacterium]